MNGPEHYRRAEALLDQAANTSTPEARLGLAARAQAHAMLAQAALYADANGLAEGGVPA